MSIRSDLNNSLQVKVPIVYRFDSLLTLRTVDEEYL